MTTKKRWVANKLPVVGCPECIGEGKLFIHGPREEVPCSYCKGLGYFPINMNRTRSADDINEQLKQYGNRG